MIWISVRPPKSWFCCLCCRQSGHLFSQLGLAATCGKFRITELVRYKGTSSQFLDGHGQPWPKAFADYGFIAKLAWFVAPSFVMFNDVRPVHLRLALKMCQEDVLGENQVGCLNHRHPWAYLSTHQVLQVVSPKVGIPCLPGICNVRQKLVEHAGTPRTPRNAWEHHANKIKWDETGSNTQNERVRCTQEWTLIGICIGMFVSNCLLRPPDKFQQELNTGDPGSAR